MNLTVEEKFVLRAAFEAGLSARQAAKMSGRSSRTVYRYFSFYGGKPWSERDGRPPPRKLPAPPQTPLRNPERFYASEFEPT